MSDKKLNPDYLRRLRDAVAEFEREFRRFLELHVVTTNSLQFGARGVIPAVVAKQDSDPAEIERSRSAVAQAAGRAGAATGLTNTYVVVQGLGRIDPLGAWDSITKPKPALEAEDVLGAAAMMIGRLDGLIMEHDDRAVPEDGGQIESTVPHKKLSEPARDDRRPRVFVGSSVEGLGIAESLQVLLQFSAEVEIWTQGLFGPGPSTLESLVGAAPSFDFAVMVVNPDDDLSTRGTHKHVARDNVIFEMGLFIGVLGKSRTFMIFDRENKPDLPSDLAGVTPATFVTNSTGNMDAAVGPAATVIKRAIQELGLR